MELHVFEGRYLGAFCELHRMCFEDLAGITLLEMSITATPLLSEHVWLNAGLQGLC